MAGFNFANRGTAEKLKKFSDQLGDGGGVRKRGCMMPFNKCIFLTPEGGVPGRTALVLGSAADCQAYYAAYDSDAGEWTLTEDEGHTETLLNLSTADVAGDKYVMATLTYQNAWIVDWEDCG